MVTLLMHVWFCYVRFSFFVTNLNIQPGRECLKLPGFLSNGNIVANSSNDFGSSALLLWVTGRRPVEIFLRMFERLLPSEQT